MIDKLRSIAVFAAVVDQGTFRGAAQHLGLAPSRVSEIVSDLERDLGVTLLYRSTRRLSLSSEGRTLYHKAQDMMAAAAHGLDAINPSSKEPVGTLRVTLPAFTAQTNLMDAIAGFSKTYPRVELILDFTDTTRDLIKDGFDVGIRAGWLKDSDLLTRNIGTAERLLVASPAYLKTHPQLRHPSDLEALDWIGFTARPNQTILTHAQQGEAKVTTRSTVYVSSADALYEMSMRDLGVTAIPESLANRGIARGDLVQLLPDWHLMPLGLHAVWPGQSRRENLTTLFVRALAASDSAAAR